MLVEAPVPTPPPITARKYGHVTEEKGTEVLEAPGEWTETGRRGRRADTGRRSPSGEFLGSFCFLSGGHSCPGPPAGPLKLPRDGGIFLAREYHVGS